MRQSAVVPNELEIQTDVDASERLKLVGPTFAGAIYRSADRLYRVLPTRRVPPAGRSAVENVKGRREPGVAPIEEADQDPGGLYWIRYTVTPARTMAEVLREPDPRVRFEHAVRVLAAFEGWSKAMGQALMPMPAEVVFADGKGPEFLTMPYLPPLDVEELAAQSERAWFLAPELIRGLKGGTDQSAGQYALAATLLRCFYEPPTSSGTGDLLERVANGTAFDVERLQSVVPSWLARLEATHEVIEIARKMMSRDRTARPAVETAQLADRLEKLAARMEPIPAVTALRESGKTGDAFSLLQDVLLEDESYELLMLGGELAEELNRPLEAIDLLERARAKWERPEPYERQLEIILPILSGGELGEVFLALTGGEGEASLSDEGARTTGERLERRMLRDFGKLIPERRERFEEPIARSLIARESYEAAASFIRPRLFEDDKYLWWKFGMAIPYAVALFGFGGPDNEANARELVEQIKGALRKVRENRSMDPEEIERHGCAVTELEVEMTERGSRRPGPLQREG